MINNFIPETLKQLFPIKNKNGRIQADLCIFITLYFEKGWEQDTRAGIVKVFDQYCTLFGEVLMWSSKKGKGWKKVNPQEISNLADYLSIENVEPDESWCFHHHGGTGMEDACPFHIRALGDSDWSGDLGYIQCSVSADWFFTHIEDFVSLVKTWCDWIQPIHGYGGIGIAETPSFSTTNHHVLKDIAKLYPGIELDYPHFSCLYLQEGIRGVNWLTIVNDTLLKRIEQPEHLLEKEDSDLSLILYKQGIIFRSGKAPQSGDLDQQIFPESYRKTSGILKSLRIDYPDTIGPFTNSEAKEWLARFDD